MKGFSFSAMGRIAACAPAAVLPRSETQSDAAGKGHIVHAFLRDVNAMGMEAAIERVPEEHRDACEVIDLSALPLNPEAYAAEVAFAYDVDAGTAREIGRDIDRGYAGLIGDREIPGTLDVVGLTEDAVIYLDFKTGHADLGPAKENWQLRIGALAAARAYGRTRAQVGIIRIREDGEPYYQRAELSELDLDATEEEIRQVVARVEHAREQLGAGEQPTTTEGDHCRYCPAFNFCPAKKSLAVIVGAGGPVLSETLDDEIAAAAIRRLDAIKAVTDRAWAVIEERARIRPIPMGGGQLFGPRPHAREDLDPAKVRAVLTERFDAEVAAALAVEEATTIKALDKALRVWVKKTPGAKITKVMKATREAIREAGASTVSVSHPCKVYTPEVPATAALPAGDEAKPAA